MKRVKQLWPEIMTFENLLLASRKAQLGKRFQPEVGHFNAGLERELVLLKQQLSTKTYRPGPYRAFYIQEPKPRMISAAPYRDRVVHHALCNIITPILDRCMIYDTYANRKGKGTHKAILRFQHYLTQYPYVLKCDIQKFFPSIDHAILKATLRRKIGCQDTLWLIDTIIDSSNPQERSIAYYPGDTLFTPYERRRGLPIGNLTSQWFGNYHLSPMDHFIKNELRCKAYVRYVDDFVLLAHDKETLYRWQASLHRYLASFRMSLHPRKTKVWQATEGIGFLGHRIFPTHRLLNSDNVRRFRKRLKRMIGEVYQETLPTPKLQERVQAWAAHAAFSDTYALQQQVYDDIWGSGICLT